MPALEDTIHGKPISEADAMLSIAQAVQFPLDAIIIGERMRTDLGNIEEMMDSFNEIGQMQPVGIDRHKRLVWGGRRCETAKRLGWTHIKVVLAETDGSMTALRMMELEENLKRKEMTWKERVLSICELHNLHQKEAHGNGLKWAMQHTGELLGVAYGKVRYSLIMGERLKNPNDPIQKCESLTQALQVIAQEQVDAAQRLLVAQTIPTAPKAAEGTQPTASMVGASSIVDELASLVNGDTPTTEELKAPAVCGACEGTGKNSRGAVCPICNGQQAAVFQGDEVTIPFSQMFFLGDTKDLMKGVQDASIDHIVTDPPYAIEMDNIQGSDGVGMNIETTRSEHDVEENLELVQWFIPEAFRVLKDGGFCILWCDYMHFRWLHDEGKKAGFSVQRWPFEWVKTGPAQNRAAQFNFTKKTEIAIIMRKKGVLRVHQPDNYILWGEADKQLFPHPFAKPTDVWERLLRAVALPGQTVLDPFAGTGSGVYAAAKVGLSPRAFEKVEKHYNNMVLQMQQAWTIWMHPKKVKIT